MKFNILVKAIQQVHYTCYKQAAKAINTSLIIRNWLIGFYIVEFEQQGEDRAKYGTKLLASLADKFTHINGLDERTFRNFRLLYNQYPQIKQTLFSHLEASEIWGSLTTEFEIAQNTESESSSLMPNIIRRSLTTESELNTNRLEGEMILAKLSYTHLEQLIRIQDQLKRTFYEVECIKGNWGVRELKRQINSLYYERSGMSLKPEKLSAIVAEKATQLQPEDIVKSMYTCKPNQEGFQNLLGFGFQVK